MDARPPTCRCGKLNYWPDDSGQPAFRGAMLMASYDDGLNIGFWDGLRPKRRRAQQPARRLCLSLNGSSARQRARRGAIRNGSVTAPPRQWWPRCSANWPSCTACNSCPQSWTPASKIGATIPSAVAGTPWNIRGEELESQRPDSQSRTRRARLPNLTHQRRARQDRCPPLVQPIQ